MKYALLIAIVLTLFINALIYQDAKHKLDLKRFEATKQELLMERAAALCSGKLEYFAVEGDTIKAGCN